MNNFQVKRTENFLSDPSCMDRQYHFLEELGSGGFGKVKLAIHILTDEKVAIKIIDKKAIGPDLPRVNTELEALKQLSHQNICRMYQFVETEEKYFIVMEYCNGGEMFDYIVRKERLGESEARHFFRQLVQAVAYIHSLGFAHRDLKPENLLITQDLQLKVIDFGLCAKPLNGLNRPLETCCGSPAYAAPELIKNVSYFGNEVDIWSMGVLLYTLVCGTMPFDDENAAIIYKRILMGHYIEPGFLSPVCKDFLRSMLTVDPKKRATIRQILSHPWLNKNYEQHMKWQTIYSRDVIDEDVIREMSFFFRINNEDMKARIKQWYFDYVTATYLILLQKKERKQNFNLLYRGADKLSCSPTIHASLDQDLNVSGIEESLNSIASSDDNLQVRRQEKIVALKSPQMFTHSPQPSVGRRINKCRLDTSPPSPNNYSSRPHNPINLISSTTGAAKINTNSNNKENQQPKMANVQTRCPVGLSHPQYRDNLSFHRPMSVYTTPRRGPINTLFSPITGYRRPNSVERTSPRVNIQQQTTAGGILTSQQQRSNSIDRRPSSASPIPSPTEVGSEMPPSTPIGARVARVDYNGEGNEQQRSHKSPGRFRQRVFSSLERKADKMINLLTPKKIKADCGPTKLKCIKNMINVSVTSSTDPVQVREELWKVLHKQGMDTTKNGWKICGSKKGPIGRTVVELEVVAIENMQYVGVKRKRIEGDAFMYKRICEEVLQLAGL